MPSLLSAPPSRGITAENSNQKRSSFVVSEQLDGEEVGQLIARAVEASATERRPWYEPIKKLPQEPLINGAMLSEFDTLVVELPRSGSLCQPPASTC